MSASRQLARLNALETSAAAAELRDCCASARWVAGVLAGRPYATVDDLLAAADEVWRSLAPDDWLEAFAAHPRIGAAPAEVDATPAPRWSRREQAGMEGAAVSVRAALAEGNDRYAERFGFVFLICAQGLDAETMLASLERRLANDRATEVAIAAEEQRRITTLRLRRYLDVPG